MMKTDLGYFQEAWNVVLHAVADNQMADKIVHGGSKEEKVEVLQGMSDGKPMKVTVILSRGGD